MAGVAVLTDRRASPDREPSSTPELLALHGVRVLGGPSGAQVAERYGLRLGDVREHLLDAQAHGWASRHEFFGETWSLTDTGRTENERQLAEELDAAGAREVLVHAHRDFLPLNRRHGVACTRWQLRSRPGAPAIFNDHTDPVWDDDVLGELEAIDADLADVAGRLTGTLPRFDGHAQRHRLALARARAGDPAWVDGPDRASCQLVWMQLHEDLLATLGIPRGSDG